MAFVGMAQYLVCLRDPLETFLRIAITRIDIRVKSPRESSKGFLDVRHRSGPCDFKNDIKVVSSIHPNTAYCFLSSASTYSASITSPSPLAPLAEDPSCPAAPPSGFGG